MYLDKQNPGELWLRNLKNNVDSASSVLSSVYLKYQFINTTFFSQLTANEINRFDLFYDVFFIETSAGCIFEKFYIDNESIQPYNHINLFNVKKSTTVDYWFSEKRNKVNFVEIYTSDTINSDPIEDSFKFILIFKTFDCTTGLIKGAILDQIKLAYTKSINWDASRYTIENPKLTYNADTKTFNVSFILRNADYVMGLVSINILDGDIPVIEEVNGFLPYFIIDSLNSSVSSIKTLPVEYFNAIKTELGYYITTELSEILEYDVGA